MKKDTLHDLLRSIASNDKERVLSALTRAAAASESSGNHSEATMLLGFSQQISRNRYHVEKGLTLLSPAHRRSSLEAFEMRPATRRLSDVILPSIVLSDLNRFLNEQAKSELLKARGLQPKRKLLFYGGSGTGKTLVAETLAAELNLPFYVLNVGRMLESYFSNSLKNLDAAFAGMEETPGVFLFDEFDSISASRGGDKEVAEMNRVVSGLLVLMDGLQGDSIVVAASNQTNMIDTAFRRRFDVVCHFPDPTHNQRKSLIERTAAKYGFTLTDSDSSSGADVVRNLSFHETEEMALSAIKTAILAGDSTLNFPDEVDSIQSRLTAFQTI